ncbi:MAG TPA: ABC transporter permease subunit [Thermomicrobiales bacterium]|nr:ABC transporter permease subunit [Thermomicrobiales bacterium]
MVSEPLRDTSESGSIELVERIRSIPWLVWVVAGFGLVWVSTRLSGEIQFPSEVLGISTTIPLADWTNSAISWMTTEFDAIFDAITRFILRRILVPTEKFLIGIPWQVFLAVVGVLGWFSTRSKLTTLTLVLLMAMIGSFGYWELAMITLAIIIAAVFLSLLIGLPLGILAAQSQRFDAVLRPILDGMQTMPAFVYLLPAMFFFGLGKVPAVIATIVYAVPPLIRLTTLGIKGVSPAAIEAAESYGATRWQILRDVEMPLALPAIMAGINQTTMMALAMVVIAALVGAGGLGLEVLLALNRLDTGRGATAGLSIVALAIIIDRITQGFARRYEESIK